MVYKRASSEAGATPLKLNLRNLVTLRQNALAPVNVALAKELPAKLTVTSKLPSLRGSPKSNFEYTLNIKNDSGRNLVASFAAEAPSNFETSFTEAYGSQELSDRRRPV